MLSLPPAVRVLVCLEPTDLRCGFDRLARLVREVCLGDPLSGHLFVFGNRRRDRVKVLYWDRDGYALWYKRLEQGAFRFPEADAAVLSLNSEEFWALLSGLDLSSVKRSRRYRRPE